MTPPETPRRLLTRYTAAHLLAAPRLGAYSVGDEVHLPELDIPAIVTAVEPDGSAWAVEHADEDMPACAAAGDAYATVREAADLAEVIALTSGDIEAAILAEADAA